MSGKTKFTSAHEYFNAQPTKTRSSLYAIKECILRIVPTATELINYGIPAYALIKGGKRDHQIMIAGYERHVGFYPHPSTMEKFEPELTNYKRGKGSVQFPLDRPLPLALIEKMVSYRMELLTE